jgi:type II secretory pathway component PulC
MRTAHALSLCLVTLATAACGGAQPAARSANADGDLSDPAPAAAPTTTAAVTEKVTSLSRAQVRFMIRSGLGVFFQNVALDDFPVMQNNKFHGFKIRAMNPAWSVDLRPGDVVTRVNGMPIEHPEEADAAMRALEKAPALKIDYERDGKAAVFELPIVEDGQAPAAEKRAR